MPELPRLGKPPNNLPIQLTSFIGRREELVELVARSTSSVCPTARCPARRASVGVATTPARSAAAARISAVALAMAASAARARRLPICPSRSSATISGAVGTGGFLPVPGRQDAGAPRGGSRVCEPGVVMRALGWRDLLVVCIGIAFFALHFALTGFASHLLSPWLISSILVGWIFGRIAIDRIERS